VSDSSKTGARVRTDVSISQCSTLLGRQPLRRLEAKTLDAVAQGIPRQMQKARGLCHIPLAQSEGLQQHVVFDGGEGHAFRREFYHDLPMIGQADSHPGAVRAGQ